MLSKAPNASSDPPVATTASSVRLGRFEFRLVERLLLNNGVAVPLGSRATQVLVALVQSAGNLLTKDELLQAAWPGLVVEEANVHVAVSQLRKVLGKAAISTVAGLGYRLAVAVQPWQVARDADTNTPADGDSARAAVPNTPHVHLPAPRTPFVGRQRDLQQAASQLHNTRLLTLVGMGGMGKTRLAVALAQRVQLEFVGGVSFVDLAPLPDLRAVPSALARALGLPAALIGTQADAQAAATAHLQSQAQAQLPVLLVLDNCEHLQPALVPWVASLLSQAASTTVLATSRQALQLSGEQVYPLTPLQIPPAAAPDGYASEAELLFLQCAQAVNPQLQWAPHNRHLVADICRRLDGIPLALELAAARLKMLSVLQLHGLLTQRFELLTRSAPGTERHRTLQDVLQWTLDHLSPAERRMAMSVAVCSGGFDLDTAAVLFQGSAPVEEGSETPSEASNPAPNPTSNSAAATTNWVAALDVLAELADHALIHVQSSNTSPHANISVRYGMLETVREFLLAQYQTAGQFQNLSVLADVPAYKALRAQHLHVFHRLALQAEQHAGGPDAAHWLARLEADRTNLLSALAWCQQHGLAQTGLEMATALKAFWLASGLLEEGLQALEQALQRVAHQPPTGLSARALRVAAQLCGFMTMDDRASTFAHLALAQADVLGDETGAASALCMAGRMAAKADHKATATPGAAHANTVAVKPGEALLQQALQRATRAKAWAVVGDALNALAFAAIERDDLMAAEAYFEQALQASQQRGSVIGALIETLNLAWVAVMNLDLSGEPKADQQANTALALQRLLAVWHGQQTTPHRILAQELVDVCASFALRLQQVPLAVQWHAASDQQRGSIHVPLSPKQAQQRALELTHAQATLGPENFAAALAQGRSQTHEALMQAIAQWLQQPLKPWQKPAP